MFVKNVGSCIIFLLLLLSIKHTQLWKQIIEHLKKKYPSAVLFNVS